MGKEELTAKEYLLELENRLKITKSGMTDKTLFPLGGQDFRDKVLKALKEVYEDMQNKDSKNG